MSTIHHVCTSCFFHEKRGFTFVGSVPGGAGVGCPECSSQMHRIVRLGEREFGPEIELVRDGDYIVVREPRWERLRQSILATLLHLWRYDVVRRPDGIIELPLRDRLSLLVRPVHDQITGQQGCLLACPLAAIDDHSPREVRALLGTMNDWLLEPVLMLGTMRDLFTLADATPTAFFRQFVSRGDLLDPEHFAEIIERAMKVSLHVHQALGAFGFSEDAMDFIERVELPDPVPPMQEGESWEVLADEMMNRQGAMDLDELLARSDKARALSHRSGDESESIESFLLGLDIDLEGRSAVKLVHDEIEIDLTVFRDDKDGLLRLSVEVATIEKEALTEDVADRICALASSFELGDLHLAGDPLRVVLRETLLADDLDVAELASALAAITRRAEAARDLLGVDRDDDIDDDAIDIGEVVERAERRTPIGSIATREEHIVRRIHEYLTVLQLRPSLTDAGGYRLVLDGIRVELFLNVTDVDALLALEAHCVEGSDQPRTAVLLAVRDLDLDPGLGGFRYRDGDVAFVDVIAANALDINELARSLYEVVDMARSAKPHLRARLQGDVTRLPSNLELTAIRSARANRLEGLVAQYRRGPDDVARRRLVRAMSLFGGAEAGKCLIEALSDPSAEVAEAATAGLVAEVSHDEAKVHADIANIVRYRALSDDVRLRAVRILGAARADIDGGVASLHRVASTESESVALRTRSIEALAALGADKRVADALVRSVADPTHAIGLTALEALASINLDDTARLFLAADAAIDSLKNRSKVEQASAYRAIGRLGMYSTIIDLIGANWQEAPEVAAALADACASPRNAKLDPLRQMLLHERGAFRAIAYRAIADHKLTSLADEVAEALPLEQDVAMMGKGIDVLRTLAVFTPTIEAALLALAGKPMLRERALGAIAALTP